MASGPLQPLLNKAGVGSLHKAGSRALLAIIDCNELSRVQEFNMSLDGDAPQIEKSVVSSGEVESRGMHTAEAYFGPEQLGKEL